MKSLKSINRGAVRSRNLLGGATAASALVVALGVGAQSAFAAGPTAMEQYMIQIINRARANPTAEAARYPASDYEFPASAGLNEGPPSTTITTAAKPPLAVNVTVNNVAEAYTQNLLATDQFAHGIGGDTGTRLTNAGYAWSTWGENLGSASSTSITQANVDAIEKQLFIDSGTAGRGHRTNLMGDYKVVGIGLGQKNGFGGFASFGIPSIDAAIATEEFTTPNPDATFLTGAVYNDNVTADGFYTPGEGQSGVTITAVNALDASKIFTTTSLTAGGYSLQLPVGTYIVTAVGPQLGTVSAGTISVGAVNVQHDFTAAAPEPASLALCGLAAFSVLARRRV